MAPPVIVTTIGVPPMSAPCALQAGVGDVLRVSQTRDGVIGWNSPAGVVVSGAAKYPSTSARTFTVRSAFSGLTAPPVPSVTVTRFGVTVPALKFRLDVPGEGVPVG